MLQGLLLDCDAATLTMWLNGQWKGVMARPGMTDDDGEPVGRLEGPLRWGVDLAYGASVAVQADGRLVGEEVDQRQEAMMGMAKDNRADEIRHRLVEHGLTARYRNSIGQTALHVAAIWNATEAAEVLLEHGAKIDATNDMSGATREPPAPLLPPFVPPHRPHVQH